MNIDWNAKGYQKDFAFVPKYGEAVLDLIDAAPGALAVDLGCGNGGLTGKLIERGYRVVGVDASAPMLAFTLIYVCSVSPSISHNRICRSSK